MEDVVEALLSAKKVLGNRNAMKQALNEEEEEEEGKKNTEDSPAEAPAVAADGDEASLLQVQVAAGLSQDQQTVM